MDRPTVSAHELAVYRTLRAARSWVTNAELARRIEETGIKISARTVRSHTARMVDAGVVYRVELTPAHAFALAKKPPKTAAGYLARLREADEAFA